MAHLLLNDMLHTGTGMRAECWAPLQSQHTTGTQGQGDRGGSREPAACWPHSFEAGSCILLTLTSGRDLTDLRAGRLGEKAAHSSSFSREELGMPCHRTFRKTACLLKAGSSYMLAWKICLVLQALGDLFNTLLVGDCLLSLLRKCSPACRAHWGQSRSWEQFDVSGCDQSSFVAAPSCPLQNVAKQIMLAKEKSIAGMGAHSIT